MAGRDDDHLPVSRLEDAEDEDARPSGEEEVRASLGADLIGTTGEGPRTYQQWLRQIDWPRTFASVVDAERALAELAERWHASGEGPAFAELMRLEEAVSQARMEGWVTTRYRVRERLLLVDEEAEKHLERYRPFLRISAGDSYAIKALAQIRQFYEPPWRLTVNAILAAGFHTGGISLDDEADSWDAITETEEERLAERLEEWLVELRREMGTQSPVVRTAAAIWRLRMQTAGLVAAPGMFERFLAPALLVRRDSRMVPPFLTRAFMDRMTSWRPSDRPDVWLRRFAEGVARSARMAKGDLSLLEQRAAVAREKTADRRSNSRVDQVALLIARREMTTAAAIRRFFGKPISDRGVRKMLDFLEERGLVQEITGRQRFRIYAHPTVGRHDLFLEPVREGGGSAQGLDAARGPIEMPEPAVTASRQAHEVDLSQLMQDAERASRRIDELRHEGLGWLSRPRDDDESEEDPEA
ncbi:hypothetical protein CKO28_08950 [Rhodovibrio sodomensis]|uniref:Uncharacterized protein n=1 Tax=Rhodovibrio sodomensis TaxID=1088 RepID=A0ABS1DF53_9PROT|nr:hypothetical protein [Rhodovibrio sodomensis]MBK1668163.1 hypothetical protein [Rhodovibrio sodomensis]